MEVALCAVSQGGMGCAYPPRGTMAYRGMRQWAAVITHLGHTRKPPQTCCPSIWMEAMKGREWGATTFPPMIWLPWVPAGGAGGHWLSRCPEPPRKCSGPGSPSPTPQPPQPQLPCYLLGPGAGWSLPG